MQGAEMCVLLQGLVDRICSGWVHTAETFDVGTDWAEQTVTLDPDSVQIEFS